MKIEEKIREILTREVVNLESPYKVVRLGSEEWAEAKVRSLTNLFKSYTRSLVPERKNYDNDDIKNPEFTEICAYKDGWNECREEMLRRIEER